MAAILNFAAAIVGGGIGWYDFDSNIEDNGNRATTAADYNVMRPVDTKRVRIYLVSYASLMLSMAPSEIVGAACGTAIFTDSRYETAYERNNIGGLLDEILRSLGNAGRLVSFLLFLFAAMSSTILAKYSTGFAIQVDLVRMNVG
ncbi:Purine-cytosine permease FCY22 [Neolecta irregularis DAH-3]|uniref:Purine-cytosine permease FCY22 n=1 Tax=Neolecta irregularis (strain DAH-3) TaxID=1198029 RepID=A0A1U7LLJ0_NEOID|nr:Purine-cytosine permease FCY22 [Neolecta irregularis DAH-3]|eukprot:OLL23525.1 Purine-cytosine permease FCY22 [Neolecta irregularis DAH-3]